MHFYILNGKEKSVCVRLWQKCFTHALLSYSVIYSCLFLYIIIISKYLSSKTDAPNSAPCTDCTCAQAEKAFNCVTLEVFKQAVCSIDSNITYCRFRQLRSWEIVFDSIIPHLVARWSSCVTVVVTVGKHHIKSMWRWASYLCQYIFSTFITKLMKCGYCCTFSGHSLYFFYFLMNGNMNSH